MKRSKVPISHSAIQATVQNLFSSIIVLTMLLTPPMAKSLVQDGRLGSESANNRDHHRMTR